MDEMTLEPSESVVWVVQAKSPHGWYPVWEHQDEDYAMERLDELRRQASGYEYRIVKRVTRVEVVDA